MASILSTQLSRIKPSPTLSLAQRAEELKRQGQDILNLSTGEPDFITPSWICDAAYKAMREGQTKYTAVTGTLALKEAIQHKLQRENNLSYTPEQLIVSTGGKQVLFNALMATLNPGDEVIIPAPYWVSYIDIVKLFSAIPIVVPCHAHHQFRLSAEDLEKSITPQTKWLILNAPNNPTGTIYSQQDLQNLSAVLLRHPHVQILSDDIYEHLIYDEEQFYNILNVEPALYDRTLIINGVSKSYAMTGWRIGYGAGSPSLIKAMGILQSQSTSNACSIAQAAAVAALNGPQEFLKEWRLTYKKRRDLMIKGLESTPLSVIKPLGAFYLYLGCQEIINKKTHDGRLLATDQDLSEYFLTQAKIAVVAGEAFGMSPYLRLSYATDETTLEKAIQRIQNLLGLLKD